MPRLRFLVQLIVSAILVLCVAGEADARCRRRRQCCESQTPAARLSRPYPADDCPPNTAEANAQEFIERVNRFTNNFYAWNFSNETVECTLKYVEFVNGVKVHDYCCWQKVRLAPGERKFFYQASNNPDANNLTAEFIDVWNVVIVR